MLRRLHVLASDAAFGFFQVGFCRRVVHLLWDHRSLDAIEVGEPLAHDITAQINWRLPARRPKLAALVSP